MRLLKGALSNKVIKKTPQKNNFSLKIYILGGFFLIMRETTNKNEKSIGKKSKKKKEEDKNKTTIDILKLFSPGTSLRTALDDLLRARLGALIVFENPEVIKIIEKSFKINSKFNQQKLVELSKMDGAIVLSSDGKKILYANTLLYPSLSIQTSETGTRHKAAERTARETGTIVIAVSERKNKITIYSGDLKYELQESSEILRRAAETLQILEKQREIFNDNLSRLNFLEVTNTTTVFDVCTILQRLEIINEISGKVKRYLIELGNEGKIVNMRLKELTSNLRKYEYVILEDYFGDQKESVYKILQKMNFDFLLEKENIARMLFDELQDRKIAPRGQRILRKTNILQRNIDELINKFGSLDKIFGASDKQLEEVFNQKQLVESFRASIKNIKEKIVMGQNI